MLDTANGMLFLHSGTPPKIHRDLKPQNLLVTNNWRIKIADFGTIKLVSTQTEIKNSLSRSSSRSPGNKRQSVASTTQIGTIHYMAPELHAKKRVLYSKEIDVYSFGMTMWAVAKETGEDPFSDLPVWEVADRVIKGDRPSVSPDWRPLWSNLMQRCWDANPSQRPSFEEITAELQAMHLDEE